MGWKELDWKFKLIIMLVICSIVGVIVGFIASAIVRQIFGEPTQQGGTDGIFWIRFGIGFIIPIGNYLIEETSSERSKRYFRLKAGNVYEKVEKVEEKTTLIT